VAWRLSSFNDVMRRTFGFEVLIGDRIKVYLVPMALYRLDLIPLGYAVIENGKRVEVGAWICGNSSFASNCQYLY